MPEAGFYCIVDKGLIAKGFFQILIHGVEVRVEDFYDAIQLAANADG